MASADSQQVTIAVPSKGGSHGKETLSSGAGALDHLPIGTEIGRYVLLSRLGEGGMGVVYAAYDPKLDRRVALKLLRSAGSLEDASARLLREAQSLAKLAHPNVVTVHDAGLLGDAVFVEMEYVEGQTLDEWVKGRPWREILDAFRQAGRGLAAAHEVGLVHRDFKPSNAIVDAAGRVRVLDFGLARPVGEASRESAPVRSPEPTEEVVVRASAPATDATSVVTGHGVVLGTPAFMPPEQWLGNALYARADQYAFAASLFESLYGALPFPEASFRTMLSEEGRGPVPPRPAGTRVPPYVHPVLVRALAYAPEGRYPSMTGLLDALATDPRERTKRRVVVGAAVVVALSAVTLGVRHERARAAQACSGFEARLGGVWDPTRSAAVHAALASGGKPGAEAAWEHTRALLDGQVKWTPSFGPRGAVAKVEPASFSSSVSYK